MPGQDTQSLHPYVDWLFTIDPILANTKGDPRGRGLLGDITPEATAEHDARRSAWLAQAEQAAEPAHGTAAWLDHQVLLTHLRTAVRRADVNRPERRAPYTYTERLGAALSTLMGDPADTELGESLSARLAATAGWLQQAQRNLTCDTPSLWAQAAADSAAGLEAFIGTTVPAYAAQMPAPLAHDVTRAASSAVDAVTRFRGFIGGLTSRARGEWACGPEQFTFLLRTFHHLDMDTDQLADHGRGLVARHQAELERIAARRDRDSDWRDQIDQIKDHHPEPGAFLTAYGDAMRRAREHTVRARLVTIPGGAECRMAWVPEYRRAGMPLGYIDTAAPYAADLRSTFFITPGDPGATPRQQHAHMRDNCYAFITCIAGHESYPGHHLQSVHHILGTPRDSIRRYFTTPQFVEGWGLYVEDVLAETGFLDDLDLQLVKARNTLWRALRVVVDVGLHTRTMSVPEAIDLMRRDAGMDEHMATGEIHRYTRHDNPTYPSSYLLGRDLIHDLRDSWARRNPCASDLRPFHDWLLSFGSPPLTLLRHMNVPSAPAGPDARR